jgi:Tetratricopeptide repeat
MFACEFERAAAAALVLFAVTAGSSTAARSFVIKQDAAADRGLGEWTVSNQGAVTAVGDRPDADAVARSLIDATTTICVPYVVDGTPIDQLTRRSDASERVDTVHGVEVVRFVIDSPGRPVVTPSPARDFGPGADGKHIVTDTSCWMTVSGTGDFARQVVGKFRSGLVLNGYRTTEPHPVEMWGVLRESGPPLALGVTCVHGGRETLVTVSNPDFKFQGPNADFMNAIAAGAPQEIEVNVVSGDGGAAAGCIPIPPSAQTPTPEQAEAACLPLPGTPLDQQVEGCTVVIVSRLDPDQDWAHYDTRGNAYFRLRQYDHAIEDYEAALRLKPDDTAAGANLAKAKAAQRAPP